MLENLRELNKLFDVPRIVRDIALLRVSWGQIQEAMDVQTMVDHVQKNTLDKNDIKSMSTSKIVGAVRFYNKYSRTGPIELKIIKELVCSGTMIHVLARLTDYSKARILLNAFISALFALDNRS